MINLVLLHGWGGDSRTWKPLLPALQNIATVTCIDLPGFGNSEVLDDYSLAAVLTHIEEQLPECAVVMGWSLGGMLAVQLAVRYPQKIIGVISLAANLKFVATADYPSAIARAVNRDFNARFAQDSQATLKLFDGLLAQGDDNERALLKQLRRSERSDVTPQWLQALELLAQLDNRVAFSSLTVPGLHLLAANDALVPVAAASVMAGLNPQQQVSIIDNCAHALHWSHPQQVMDEVSRFLSQLPLLAATSSALLDKKKIAQSFGRAAATYDSVAQLQRDVGTELFVKLPSSLPVENTENPFIVDVGSGTGFFTRQLVQAYPDAGVVGLDIAEGMLHFARRTIPESAHWLCGDAEYLPLADNSVDLIFSSLAIQWCNHLPQLMMELTRILKPGGRLFIATLGPATLHELKTAWQQVDNYVHVNRFVPATELAVALEQGGLHLEQLQTQTRVLYFARVNELTRELKALGAHNINSGKPEGLTGRARLSAFKTAYEQYRTAQGLPASYEVIYITVYKPRAEQSHG